MISQGGQGGEGGEGGEPGAQAQRRRQAWPQVSGGRVHRRMRGHGMWRPRSQVIVVSWDPDRILIP